MGIEIRGLAALLMALCALGATSDVAAQTVPDFGVSTTSGPQALEVEFTNLTTSDVLIVFYTWDLGDGTIVTAGPPTHRYEQPGTYTVTLTAEPLGSGPVSITKTDLITVTPGTLDVSFQATSPVSGSAPLPVSFETQLDGTATPAQWHWDFGDGGTSSERDPTHVFASSGDYTVTLTTSVDGQQDVFSAVDLVHVDALGQPTIAVSPSSVAFGEAVQFTGGFTGPAPSGWSWDFGDGQTSIQKNPVHVPQLSGSLDVTLTVTAQGTVESFTLEDALNVAPPNLVPKVTAVPETGYAPLRVDFTGQSLGDAHDSWFWKFGNGASTPLQLTQTYQFYFDPGIYEVSLTLGLLQESATDSVLVTVLDPELEPGLAYFPRGGLTPLTVDFTDTSTSAAPDPVKTLFYGDGPASTEVQSSHTYTGSAWFTPSQKLQTTPQSDLTEVNVEHPNGIQVVQQSVVGFPSFGEPERVDLLDRVHNVLLADVDGDGRQDLLVEVDDFDFPFGTVQIWHQAPNGDFPGPPVLLDLINANPTQRDLLGAADLDLDGDLDLVASRSVAPAFARPWRNDGAGHFVPGVQVDVPTGQLAFWAVLADADEDGLTDAVLGVNAGLEQHDVWIAHGDGVGGLAPPAGPFLKATFTTDPVAADVNGDGHLDLVGRLDSGVDDTSGALVALGDGSAYGPTTGTVLLPFDTSIDIEVGDVDGDGFADVAALYADEVSLARGSPTGLQPFAPLAVPFFEVESLALGDVDGDGDADVIVSDEHALRVGRATPSGHVTLWSGVQRLEGARRAYRHALGDLDGDGALDMVSAFLNWSYVDGPHSLAAHRNLGAIGRWVDIGGEMTGAAGALRLDGTGELRFDTPVGFQLTGAQPFASALLVIGLADLLVPFQGGVLVPRPDIVVAGFFTDALGELHIDALWPGNVPAQTPSWYQVWVSETGQLVGSNGLLAIAAD